MELYLGAVEIYIIYTVVLPMSTLALLISMRLLSPPIASRGSDFFSKLELERFSIFLALRGIRVSGIRALLYSFLISAFLSCVLFLVTQNALSACVLILPIFVYGLFLYFDDMRISQAEENLPDALFYTSSTHHMGVDKVLEDIANSSYGNLSTEFRKAFNQVKAGISIKKSLEEIVSRNPSPIIKRGVSLLIKIDEMGSSIETALKKTAEDIKDLLMMTSERSAVLSMHKYNLLIATLLLPAIFGITFSLVSKINLEYLSDIIDFSSSPDLMDAVYAAVQIYLVEFSVISSLFLADYSGSWKRFVIYLAFLLPLMISVFYFSRSIA
jgi:Flp pilus assembly protein TadB